MKTLDCTLRDGGYYTNWDFNPNLVKNYLKLIDQTPIDYLEIGYRSVELEEYRGEYFYLSIPLIKKIKSLTSKDLVVMVDEKNTKLEDLDYLLDPCKDLIKMVRIAVDPKNLDKAILLAENIKQKGFEVAINIMYLSKWYNDLEFIESLQKCNNIDYLYAVDSYGGCLPTDIESVIVEIKKYVTCGIGFHGHNNIELAFGNTIYAIRNGFEIVDSTICGMGRGAGNCKTELLMFGFMKDSEYSILSDLVNLFSELQEKYKWGTNLPYMVSGLFSLPQKDVMDLIDSKLYSYNSIINYLRPHSIKYNLDLPIYNDYDSSNNVLIIGGGPSVIDHLENIITYINNNPNLVIIFTTCKYAKLFKDITNKQIFLPLGTNEELLENYFEDYNNSNSIAILHKNSISMGNYIPKCFEGKSFKFENRLKYEHSTLNLALAIIANNFLINKVAVIGYDGYNNTVLSNMDKELFLENNSLFAQYSALFFIYSLLPTKYNIKTKSLYSQL